MEASRQALLLAALFIISLPTTLAVEKRGGFIDNISSFKDS